MDFVWSSGFFQAQVIPSANDPKHDPIIQRSRESRVKNWLERVGQSLSGKDARPLYCLPANES